MRVISLVGLSFFFLVLMGCSTPAALVQMPVAPEPITDTLTVTIQTSAEGDLENDVVQQKAAQAIISPSSSVVISVPVDRNKKQQIDGDFKTDGYFHIAEQQIERELIRNGFTVKDRSKFEAILRNLRDEGSCKDRWWRCSRTQIDPASVAILESLEEQFKNKEITAAEYAEQTREFQERFKVGSSGRSRSEGENELTDISEVIRAASAGDIKADYVLQINKFETDKIKRNKVSLIKYPEVQAFVEKHPDVREQFAKAKDFSCES